MHDTKHERMERIAKAAQPEDIRPRQSLARVDPEADGGQREAAGGEPAASDDQRGGTLSSTPIIPAESRLSRAAPADLLRRLAEHFMTPPPGLARPDPLTLGEPSDYGGMASHVKLLQMGLPADDVLAMLPAELRAVIAATDPDRPPAPPLDLLTADHLLTTVYPDPVWAIPDLLPAGLAVLAGKPKTGKSWLALQWAQAVATGGRAFGRQVERGPVLYLALEDNEESLQERMKAQGWPLGADCEFMTMAEFAQQIGDLRTEGGDLLAGQIELRRYRLVVIDTLSRAVSGDQSDVSEMTRALAPIHVVSKSHNCCSLFVDHHNKGFGRTPDAVLDILGSIGKAAVPDTLLGLYREKGKATADLVVTGRRVADQKLALQLDRVTACWQCLGDAEQLEMTERRQEILDALLDLGEATAKAIGEATDQKRSNVYPRLNDLVTAGKVVKTDSKPAKYRLV